MKQFYFKSIFLSLLMMVTGGVVALAAEEETIATFTASVYNSDPAGGWTVSNADYATAGGGYYKLITSDASIVSPSINFSNYSDITITISARKFGGPDATQGKISVSQGETELASYSPSGTSIAASSALEISPADGTITISCPGASSSKGCGVGSIVIKGIPKGTPTEGIAINETNFPDDVFRAWVAENCDKAPEGGEKDGYLDDEEIAAQVIIGINNKNIEDLKGIEYFTAATMLMCDGNKLQTLDVSKNTKLTQLICYGNKLTSLNVSKNTALTSLHCTDNQLTSLNVSNNTELGMLLCQNNQLTSLDVTNNQKLTTLDCSNNLINETEMGKLVAGMPTISGDPGIFYPFNQSVEDANVITTTQVNDAKAKNWNVQAWNGSEYVDYDGVASTNNLYTLVTSVSSLTAGDEVIIVNKDAGKAMGGQNNNNRAATAVTFDADGNAVVPASTDIQVFTLEGNSDGWYFNTGSGYIYAASSSSNHLKTETEKDNNGNAKASISFSGEDAAIQFQGTNTRNLLRYNSGNDIFACYASGQSPVQIYSKPVNKTLTDIMLSGEYPTTFFVGDEFSFGETGIVTAVYDDNSTKVVTDNATFSGYDMSATGNQTVTVSYTERGVTKEQTYEITVNNRALSSITLSGDYPTTFNVGDEFSHEGMTVTATYDNNTSEDVTADATFEGYDMSTAGTQTVTVSYTKGDVTKTATYDITVSSVAVTGVTIDPSEVTLLVGKTRTLTLAIEPENATNKEVTWSSNDESVATVADGVVTAVAAGTAVITVSSAAADGISATCTVTVVDELNETTATGNLNNSDSGVFAGVEGFTGGGHTVSGTLITDAGNVAVTYAGTTNTYLCDSHIRMYSSGSTLKFTAPSGFDLTKIVLTISAGNADNIYADEGTYTKTEDKVATWTGAETDVTFKGQMTTTRLAIAEVTLEKAAPKPPLASIAVDGATTDFIVNSEFVFNGTVTATYEDQTTKDVTAKATFSKPDMTTAGTQEVTVSYTEDEVTKTATYSITVREPETVTFRKVSSTDELVAGKRYVLVNEDKQKVIGEYYNLHFEVKDATIGDERVELEEGAANFLTLGGTEGAWTFATSIETGKYVALTTDGNYLESGSSATAESAQWTITFDENGNALILSNNIEGRYINYNSSQPRFACYKSSDTNPYGTQQMIQLYVEADEVDVTISQVGYATLYYSDRALKLPAGVTAKTYTVAGGKLAESKTYDAGKVIPAGEAVVLKGAAGDYKFMVTTTSDEPDAGSMLKGTDEAVETEGGNFYYALQAKKKDGTGGPGFYWMNSTGAAFTNGAHKAYMALDKKFADAQEVGGAKSFYLFEEATGIRSAWTDGEAGSEQRFNLSGQRVGNGYKGIVIVNGKKIVIK